MFIVLSFNQEIGIFKMEKDEALIQIEGVLYRKKDCDDFLGFYDWLRLDNNTIIGVRFTFFSPWETIIPNANIFAYVSIINSKRLEIFFSEKTNYVREKSNDQDFGGNFIYECQDITSIAITIRDEDMKGRHIIPLLAVAW